MKLLLIVCLFVQVYGGTYYVELADNGPVIVGANITFTANLFINNKERPKGDYKYQWRDNTSPQHIETIKGQDVSNWTVSYLPEKYNPGFYEVEVVVFSEIILIDWPICSRRMTFRLTESLNGKLELKQDNKTVEKQYISNASEVTHIIQLNAPDLEYLKKNSSSIVTHWFLDCVYQGKTENFEFRYNYTEVNKAYHISAVVTASHEPNTTAVHVQSVDASAHHGEQSTESSTEIFLVNSTKTTDIKSNDIVQSSNNTKFSYLTINSNSTVGNVTPPDIPYDCPANNLTPKRNRSSWGLFARTVYVKAPVANVKSDGNNWLQHGEILNLQVWCNGSAPFRYCIQFYNGVYNATGNETCFNERVSEFCNVPVQRYLSNSTAYTVVVIIQNDINKVVTGIGVNVYDVTKHAQLSVIIVPVSASIVAVILIVFGIAYYIQSRNRYIVEVADFDFSNASDMEYKTFRERLVEAVSNAFNKTEDYSEQDSSNGVPASKKYGSMQ